MRPPCRFPECGRKSYMRGWCSPHYKQWLAGEEPRPLKPMLKHVLRAAHFGWIEDARCGDNPLFTTLENIEQQMLCAQCPVKNECREYAIDTGATGVVMGGIIIDSHPLKHTGTRPEERANAA